MATPTDTFVLVKATGPELNFKIDKIIRTYLSKPRAEQDWELLSIADPNNTYRIITADHIDD